MRTGEIDPVDVDDPATFQGLFDVQTQFWSPFCLKFFVCIAAIAVKFRPIQIIDTESEIDLGPAVCV